MCNEDLSLRSRIEELEATMARLMTRAPRDKKKRAIQESDCMTEKHRAFAKELGIDPAPQWAKFKNYCLAHDARYANFEAAFRNWLANSLDMKGGKR